MCNSEVPVSLLGQCQSLPPAWPGRCQGWSLCLSVGHLLYGWHVGVQADGAQYTNRASSAVPSAGSDSSLCPGILCWLLQVSWGLCSASTGVLGVVLWALLVVTTTSLALLGRLCCTYFYLGLAQRHLILLSRGTLLTALHCVDMDGGTSGCSNCCYLKGTPLMQWNENRDEQMPTLEFIYCYSNDI